MGRSWTLLARTAAAGSNTLVLQDPVTWPSGASIAIASTGTRHTQKENEVAIIASVSADGRTITLEVGVTVIFQIFGQSQERDYMHAIKKW